MGLLEYSYTQYQIKYLMKENHLLQLKNIWFVNIKKNLIHKYLIGHIKTYIFNAFLTLSLIIMYCDFIHTNNYILIIVVITFIIYKIFIKYLLFYKIDLKI